MRATSVSAGAHKLIYAYDPPSVRIGAVISLAALAGLAGLAFWARTRSGDSRPAGGQATDPRSSGP